ncbi:MAG: phage integrase N-terminal SAM-like domain-containing protein, partial [Planctomycetota bacterium]
MRNYSRRTEQTYLNWARRYVVFHGNCHPAALNAAAVSAFLEHMVVARGVAHQTRQQALNAIIFLYRHVLERPLPEDSVHAPPSSKPRRLPVVLTHDEIAATLSHLSDPYHLIAELLYGSGLRLLECLRLRVHDIDEARKALTIRMGKGCKDRIVPLP